MDQIWDPCRKLWVAHTPEEEVRQRLVQHLHHERGIALSRIGVEKEIAYYGTRKRFDVLVFDPSGNPWLLAECKAPSVPLSQEVLYQIGRYNSELKAPHMLVTNGNTLLFFTREANGRYRFCKNGWYD